MTKEMSVISNIKRISVSFNIVITIYTKTKEKKTSGLEENEQKKNI
jgi:hypothetical protein